MSIDPFGDRRFELRTFPSDDAVFADAVGQAFRALGTDLAQIELRLEAVLRRTYPATAVHPVDPLAQIPGQPPAWYVYRDGGAVTERIGATG